MQSNVQVSFSDRPMLTLATMLFAGFFAGALLIHAKNGDGAPKSIGWARFSRRLYWAAVWAALGLAVSMIAQMFSMVVYSSGGGQPWEVTKNIQGIATFGAVAEMFAIFVSLVVALSAATELLPRFAPDSTLIEPSSETGSEERAG